MMMNRRMKVLLSLGCVFGLAPVLFSQTLRIIDYQKHLNPKYQKVERSSTDYIIIHTSEAGKKSTLHTLSRGKKVSSSHRTIGGHANYAIDRLGNCYLILDPRYRADHAGKSMWNGTEDLSNHSIGIELVGFHYGTITRLQYQAISNLLDILQSRFQVRDRDVLTHAQISYGNPNYWFKKKHRGRKKCALNFVRKEAGLIGMWDYDPDVREKRLTQDPIIHNTFYSSQALARNRIAPVTGAPPLLPEGITNIIDPAHTAWSIAGEEYNQPSTLYLFPDGRKIPGDQVESAVGWGEIPAGTEVLLNHSIGPDGMDGPVFTISSRNTAWSFAGRQYNDPHTFYLYPNQQLLRGDQIPDWDFLPNNTRMIINYSGPHTIKAETGHTPWGIARELAKAPQTLYLIPGRGFIAGDKITDFSKIPRGSRLFLKIQTERSQNADR